MFKRKTLFSTLICSIALILLAIPCMISFNNAKHVDTPLLETRTTSVELSDQDIDYESVFNQFEDGKLETNETLTTFEGYQTLNLADLMELDNVSVENLEESELKVKYSFSYDSETNIVTLSATTDYENGETEEDYIYGAAFVNEQGNLDAVLDIDGEYVLLSELQDAGLIQNCGWFKKAFKKVASAVKKVCNTAVGVIGAVATVAVPVVIGVVCAATGVGLIATVAMGAIAGAAIAAGTAAASTYQQDGKVDWETVGVCAGVGAAVGAVASGVAYGVTTAIKGAASATDDVVKGAADKADDVAKNVADKADDVAKNVADKADDVAKNVADKADDVAKNVADKADDVAKNVADNADDVAKNVADKADDVAKNVADNADDVAKNVADKADDFTKNIADKADEVANTLTDAQKSNLRKLDNVVNNNLKDTDFSGTLRDLQGNPVPNGKGGYFDHLQEMKNSYTSLDKIKTSLEGSLKNPNLSSADRALLEEGLKKTVHYINKIKDLFGPFGGI